MGNDFLPHSITHKLGDDGYEYVIRAFHTMKKTDRWIVIDGKLQIPILLEICKEWSEDEEVRMLHMIQKKRQQAMRGILKGMDESEGLPLEWDVEKVMMKGGRLSENWRDVYWSWISADRQTLCAEYIYGCQWILDYYSQKPVNMAWMFPAWIPPLWSDLAAAGELVPVSVLRHGEQPSPSEQLAMVLPLKSWDLVRGELRILPSLAPQMWPLKFDFFSVGRRWLWECEARVPVLTAARVRDILNQGRIDGKCTSRS
jgi:5'-3' exonuclease